MNIQLVFVVICVLAAVAFMARKIVLTLKRRSQCSCGDCSPAGCDACKSAPHGGIREITGK